jgi:class 3 adenylate cyclase
MQSHTALSFFFDELSHVLVGAVAVVAGVAAHRAWSRRRWRRPPAAVVVEAVLAVDMVDSTLIATKHGDSLAMRARNVLERRARAAAEGVTFIEGTGDGCLMTFPSVAAAAKAAARLLDGLQRRPPDMSPGPHLEVRAAIAYGEILIDARGARHGVVINKAFRLMAVPPEAFVSVDGEERMELMPDRNRILLDEEAANELAGKFGELHQVGVCRLKGFSGFHRAYELRRSGT